MTFEYVGQTIGSKEVEVRARVTGILEKRLFREGRGQGGPAAVHHRSAARTGAGRARPKPRSRGREAQKAQADREAARLKPLAERKAIGQKEADDAASNAELAAAAVKAAQAKLRRARLNLGYTRSSRRSRA